MDLTCGCTSTLCEEGEKDPAPNLPWAGGQPHFSESFAGEHVLSIVYLVGRIFPLDPFKALIFAEVSTAHELCIGNVKSKCANNLCNSSGQSAKMLRNTCE